MDDEGYLTKNNGDLLQQQSVTYVPEHLLALSPVYTVPHPNLPS